jgi:hypothetical protein
MSTERDKLVVDDQLDKDANSKPKTEVNTGKFSENGAVDARSEVVPTSEIEAETVQAAPSNPTSLVSDVSNSSSDSKKYLAISELDTEYNQKVIKGVKFWSRFLAIFLFFGAGLVGLAGLGLVSELLSILYFILYPKTNPTKIVSGSLDLSLPAVAFLLLTSWLFAGVYLFFGIQLWLASSKIEKLKNETDSLQFSHKLLQILGSYRTMLKFIGILISFVFLFYILLFMVNLTLSYQLGYYSSLPRNHISLQ